MIINKCLIFTQPTFNNRHYLVDTLENRSIFSYSRDHSCFANRYEQMIANDYTHLYKNVLRLYIYENIQK